MTNPTPADLRALMQAITLGHIEPEVPPGALKAAKCKCSERGNEPWLERDADGFLHCSRCGTDY